MPPTPVARTRGGGKHAISPDADVRALRRRQQPPIALAAAALMMASPPSPHVQEDEQHLWPSNPPVDEHEEKADDGDADVDADDDNDTPSQLMMSTSPAPAQADDDDDDDNDNLVFPPFTTPSRPLASASATPSAHAAGPEPAASSPPSEGGQPRTLPGGPAFATPFATPSTSVAKPLPAAPALAPTSAAAQLPTLTNRRSKTKGCQHKACAAYPEEERMGHRADSACGRHVACVCDAIPGQPTYCPKTRHLIDCPAIAEKRQADDDARRGAEVRNVFNTDAVTTTVFITITATGASLFRIPLHCPCIPTLIAQT
jgi:hypothetical protein